MEYKVDCTGWSREHLLETLLTVPQHANAKIVLCWEENDTNKENLKEKIVGNYMAKQLEDGM